MQSLGQIREHMLEELQGSIESANGTPDGKNQVIIFKQDVTELCRVPFDHIDVEEEGTIAIAIFKNSIGEDTLAAPATADGTVDNFEVYGKVTTNPAPPPPYIGNDTLVLWGTVGNLGSGADIQFTRTEWNDETNVRLTRLRVVLR